MDPDTLEEFGGWECGLAYSKEELGVDPVVTAIELHVIPFSGCRVV